MIEKHFENEEQRILISLLIKGLRVRELISDTFRIFKLQHALIAN